MTTVSVDKLRAHYVCVDQLALFRATFGDEAWVTEANMRHVVDVGLHIEWLKRLLAAPARAVYEAARAQALATYVAACAQAWAVYKAACAQALAAYRRALVGPLVRALRAEGAA
jgi:hypothetical protein